MKTDPGHGPPTFRPCRCLAHDDKLKSVVYCLALIPPGLPLLQAANMPAKTVGAQSLDDLWARLALQFW